MTDRDMTNGMIFLGLDYSKGNHQIYIEGGYKGWRNSLGGPQNGDHKDGLLNYGPFQMNRTGGREAFYSYSNDNNTVKVGFQTMTLGDLLLLDERAIAATYSRKLYAFKVNLSTGTVMRDFARMGSFCGVKYLYNTIKGKTDMPIGNSIGKTNFVGGVILWDPFYKKLEENINNNDDEEGDDFKPMDEFSSDEFSSDEFAAADDEFSEVEKEKTKYIKQTGLIFYEEFGSGFNYDKYYLGVMANSELPAGMNLNLELIYQYYEDNRAFLYYGDLSRNFLWASGYSTMIGAGYFGVYDQDDSTAINTTFSNIYLGELMRLDAVDLPVFNTYVKQIIPGKLKLYVKVQWVEQIENYKVREIDMETGIKLFHHIRLTGLFGYVEANTLNDPYYMARFELRAAF